MASPANGPTPPSALRLAAAPAAISAAVTLLRLAGERLHWSAGWFSTETGGILPQGMSWLVGITWLPLPFGVYFALRLLRAGSRPPGAAHAFGHAVLGLGLAWAARFGFLVPGGFQAKLAAVWLIMAVGGALQWPTWRDLARTLLVYGLLSRGVVALVMLLAMQGAWGTHYDYVGVPFAAALPLIPRFVWLALFPQLVFWVAFTMILGALAGSVVAWVRARRPAPEGPTIDAR